MLRFCPWGISDAGFRSIVMTELVGLSGRSLVYSDDSTESNCTVRSEVIESTKMNGPNKMKVNEERTESERSDNFFGRAQSTRSKLW